MKFSPLLTTALLFLAACGDGAPAEPAELYEGDHPAVDEGAHPAEPASYLEGDPVEAMRRSIKDLRERDEHTAEELEVHHVLVSFKGAPGVKGVTRSKEEAEKLAAEIYRRALEGEDFTSLVEQFSDDPGEGRYVLMVENQPLGSGKWGRKQMVPVFGGVAWRLEVGEVGVAPYHPQKGIYGWHVVKRLR